MVVIGVAAIFALGVAIGWIAGAAAKAAEVRQMKECAGS